jgi:hypothetical protein
MLIGISGKKQHGKDTVGKIILQLIFKNKNPDTGLAVEAMSAATIGGMCNWSIKWFAEPLKDIVCILIGCTREQLEDNDFKEKELGEEWNYFLDHKLNKHADSPYPISDGPKTAAKNVLYSYKYTPRQLLQLMGTECGRQIIHPNIWVNALMSNYNKKNTKEYVVGSAPNTRQWEADSKYPNWIITDCRFPNEVKAIKDRGGIVIRVNRPDMIAKDEHESETALDNYKEFDAIITNNSDIDSLVNDVKDILETFKII